MKFLFVLILFFVCTHSFAQSLAINTTGSTAEASSILDVTATDKGMLIPRVFIDSAADKSTINLPAHSLLIYNTNNSTLNGLYGTGYYYNGGTPAAPNFIRMISNNETWLSTGNAGTNAAINFIGTTDAQDLTFRTNSLRKMILTQNGRLELFGNNTDSSIIAIGKNAGVNNTSVSGNIFIGKEVAQNNTGGQNTFIGTRTAKANTSGYENVFIGFQSATKNISGRENTFVGSNSGGNNTTGSTNTFLGNAAGASNVDGGSNTILGSDAGIFNVSGDRNVIIGNSAGRLSLSSQNVYIGNTSGYNSTSGSGNTFIGYGTGQTNKYGGKNTVLGQSADLADSSYSNATAIGANAFVNASNSMVLGSIATLNGATITVNVGIGTSTPKTRLELNGALALSPRTDTVLATTDNFLVTVGNNSVLKISSDAVTASTRTINLSNGLANGQLLFIRCIQNNINFINTANIVTTGNVDMDTNDILQFIWDGAAWYQVSFSSN